MTGFADGPLHVLHVDDEQDFLELSATCLEREDDRFSVVTATSAADGRDCLAEADIDCVVSDYRMPETHGLEFLDAVRRESPDLPFILFTGEGSEAIASEAISAGVTDYLQKDAGTGQYAILANRIVNAVEKARMQRRCQSHLRAIETANEGIGFLDDKGRFTYVNQAYADLYGYPSEDLVGEHWEVLYPTDEAERVRDEVLPELEATGSWRGETIGKRANGETLTEDHSLALTDDDRIVCIVRDASEREGNQRELEMYKAAVEATRDGITVIDTGGNYQIVNKTFTEVVGLPREEIIGKDPTFLVDCGVIDRSAVETGIEKILECLDDETEQITFETRIESPTFGEEIVEHNLALMSTDGDVDTDAARDAGEGDAATAMFTDADGATIDGAVMTHRRITDRKNRERALRARERELQRQNERLDDFASVVSHDLRNPLNVAVGRLHLVRDDYESEHVDQIEKAHARMERIIDSLLTLARQGDAIQELATVGTARVIRDAWETVETGQAERHDDWNARIRADPDRFQQLLENLFRNAVEHAGEDVTIRVRPLETERGFYVSDDGPGIPADKRDRAFEPGYSTSVEGTGLGLNIVAEIAEAHGWNVSVTDGEHGGARFEITGIDVVEPEPSSDCRTEA